MSHQVSFLQLNVRATARGGSLQTVVRGMVHPERVAVGCAVTPLSLSETQSKG